MSSSRISSTATSSQIPTSRELTGYRHLQGAWNRASMQPGDDNFSKLHVTDDDLRRITEINSTIRQRAAARRGLQSAVCPPPAKDRRHRLLQAILSRVLKGTAKHRAEEARCRNLLGVSRELTAHDVNVRIQTRRLRPLSSCGIKSGTRHIKIREFVLEADLPDWRQALINLVCMYSVGCSKQFFELPVKKGISCSMTTVNAYLKLTTNPLITVGFL